MYRSSGCFIYTDLWTLLETFSFRMYFLVRKNMPHLLLMYNFGLENILIWFADAFGIIVYCNLKLYTKLRKTKMSKLWEIENTNHAKWIWPAKSWKSKKNKLFWMFTAERWLDVVTSWIVIKSKCISYVRN